MTLVEFCDKHFIWLWVLGMVVAVGLANAIASRGAR